MRCKVFVACFYLWIIYISVLQTCLELTWSFRLFIFDCITIPHRFFFESSICSCLCWSFFYKKVGNYFHMDLLTKWSCASEKMLRNSTAAMIFVNCQHFYFQEFIHILICLRKRKPFKFSKWIWKRFQWCPYM